MPARLEPMLAKPGEVPESDSDDWGYEIKWDGVRALGYADHGKWSMLSRRLEDVSVRYPELAAIAETMSDHSAVLDGEVVALDAEGRPRFQLIQSRMGLTSPAAIKARMTEQPVDYVIFDLLHLDGHRVRDLPYVKRRELLEGLGLDGPRWRTPRFRLGGGADLLEAARRQGLEGIVAKRTDSPYRTGKRTREWVKTRVWRRQEFVIGGYIPGEGRRAKRVGSLLVGYYDKRRSELRKGQKQNLHFAGGVGSGLKEADLEYLTRELHKRERPDSPFDVGAPAGPKARLAVWCEPDLVCEVSWTEWTNQGTLRQPAFKGMRDTSDKDPREVVKEF
ncbi:MAG: bifunctional non-ous end joining protein LigD [Solirubrobacterales bacterium]|jgi:bifunctional non-homologous end joining protein LigD|nr:bifunctional non-ous end joining protein LigD [Solirubrobacterales bacterium]